MENNKTNMEYCKSVALDFLHTEIEQTTIPTIVLHPFFDSSVVLFDSTLFDITKNTNAKNKIIIQYELKINKAENVKEIFHMLRAPYRMQYFSFICDYLNEKDFAEMLSYSWTNDEYANNNKCVKISRILLLFKKANKQYMMNENDFETFQKLPDRVKIYRGVTDYNKDNIKVLSWSLSKKTAEWFSQRFNLPGKVLEKEVDKKYIYAYFNVKNEQELIVDYNAH